MKKHLLVGLSLVSSLAACQQEANVLETIFTFDSQYPEVSGMVFKRDQQLLWTLQDSGNPAELIAFNLEGKAVKTLKITQFKNTDWEELAHDAQGNLYIGDFGNNKNKRQDLRIGKINAADLAKDSVAPVQITEFYYPQQKEFPSPKKDGSYDCEAMLVTDAYIYLFSKNKNTGTRGQAIVYRLPNLPGRFAAEKLGEIKPSGDYTVGMLTGAAMSPDGKTAALLTHHSVFTFDFTQIESPENLVFTRHKLGHVSQKEALTFQDATTILLSDESESKSNNHLYRLKLPQP